MPKCGDTHFAPKCGDTHGAPKFCEIKFATERTDRELLGRPVARYSATFVFLWYKSQFCEIKFATERTDRELLGRLVARYSAVFLFYVVKVGDRPRGWSDPVSRFLILRNMPFSTTGILDFLLPCFLLPGGGVYHGLVIPSLRGVHNYPPLFTSPKICVCAMPGYLYMKS